MWTEEKNKRRCQLIDKEIDGTLTVEEKEELEKLQEEMLAYRKEKAPLLDWTKYGKGQIHISGAYVEQDKSKRWWAYPYKECWVSAQCKNEPEAKRIAIRDRQEVNKARREIEAYEQNK